MNNKSQLKQNNRGRTSVRSTSLRTRLLITTILLVFIPVLITGALILSCLNQWCDLKIENDNTVASELIEGIELIDSRLCQSSTIPSIRIAS